MPKLLDIFRHGRIAREGPEGFSRERQILRDSRLFDPTWYLKHNPDVATEGTDPVLHYLMNGAAERRNPSSAFDGNWYLERHKDVAASGQNPLVHYLEFGAAEGREIQPGSQDDSQKRAPGEQEVKLIEESGFYDPDWYRKKYPDLASSGREAAEHYLLRGGAEGREPGPVFSSAWYLKRHPDVRDRHENPLLHFLENGSTEERDLLRQAKKVSDSKFFDGEWYRERYRASLEGAAINPVLHFLTAEAAEGFHPSPKFDAKRYLQFHPDVAEANVNPLLHYLDNGAGEDRQIAALSASEKFGVPTVDDVLRTKFDRPEFWAFPVARGPKRLTLIVDQLRTGSLYGREGTSLILAALLSERMDGILRLVMQKERPGSSSLEAFYAERGIPWNGNLEIVYSPSENRREIPVSGNDFFLVTSCWTARAARAIANASRILYLVQEDERMRYSYGDERLRCEEMLSDPDIAFIVDSQLLFEHLTTGAEKLESVIKSGAWFEPAVSPAQAARQKSSRKAREKRRVVFYTEPDNPASLHWRGVEAIDAAIESGALDPEQWDFYFVGDAPVDILLLGDIRPQLLPELRWHEYGDLMRQADLGLCLQYSPHPGYPVLNLAANGAMVVTNRYGVKTSLARYSPNILCVDSSVGGLKRGIAEAVKRIETQDEAGCNGLRTMGANWQAAFEPALRQLDAFVFRED